MVIVLMAAFRSLSKHRRRRSSKDSSSFTMTLTLSKDAVLVVVLTANQKAQRKTSNRIINLMEVQVVNLPRVVASAL